MGLIGSLRIAKEYIIPSKRIFRLWI